MHHDQLKRLLLKAWCLGGVKTSATTTEWDIAGRCLSPVIREISVRPGAPERTAEDEAVRAVLDAFPGATVRRTGKRKRPAKHIRIDRKTAIPLVLRMTLPCRTCDHCRRKRRRMWAERAKLETNAAQRTWMGTLTLSPAAHAVMADRARVRLAHQAVDFDALPEPERFKERCREVGIEVTKYWKRVRKIARTPIRQLTVFEKHTGKRKKIELVQSVEGLPHVHFLAHESGQPVRWRTLASQWSFGFVEVALITDEDDPTYICKYIAKDAATRVRASPRYGVSAMPLSPSYPLSPRRERVSATSSETKGPTTPPQPMGGSPQGASKGECNELSATDA